MEQLDIFTELREKERLDTQREMFQEWMTLPAEKLILASSPERKSILADLAHGYCLRWKGAFHRCPDLPADRYIWLNEIEPPEYWVMNHEGDPCGEHIDVCPFCGADLKHGGGDVVLQKADDGWWCILGFIKKGEHEDDEE